MSAVSGLLSSSNIGTTNDLVGEFQETIFIRNTKGFNVGTTLFGLMARLRNESADNIEYNWFERNPVRKTIFVNTTNATTPAPGTADTIVFKETATGGNAWHYLDTGSILRNDVTGEYVRVSSQPTTNTVNVIRGFYGATAAWTANDAVTIITLGKDEGADPVRASYEDPETLLNYIQTFNSSVFLTNAFKGQVLRSDLDGALTDRRIQALEKISRDIEFAYLMGIKKRETATNGYQYFTGGIFHALDSNTALAANILAGGGGAGVSLATVNTWLESFMSYGSDTKLAFCGPKAYTAFSTFANSAANGFRIMQNENVFGMHITTINTPFGELSLAYHPLLKEAVGYNDWMFVVDLQLLVQKVFEPLFLEPDIQTPGQDTYKEQYRGKLGLKLKFANAFGVAKSFQKINA